MVKVDFHGITLLLPARRMAATGTAVEAGVRPEKLQIADLGQAPDNMNSIDGTIIDASFIGVSTQYLVRSLADPEEELTVFSQNSATELRRVGDQVSLLLASRAHLRPARRRLEGSRSRRGRLMISAAPAEVTR